MVVEVYRYKLRHLLSIGADSYQALIAAGIDIFFYRVIIWTLHYFAVIDF